MTEMGVIFGLQGPRLTVAEKAFFRDSNPWGFILFARNIETPDQVRALTTSIRDCVGRHCMIFIDQEGGRVQRLRPPHWYDYPSLAHVANNSADPRRAVLLHHRLIAADLRALGINADCAPVLDIPIDGADPIISDRALGDTADKVILLAQAAMTGLMRGGVAPVIKHIPGHGRAMVDSHLELPRISANLGLLAETDFRPFWALRDAPMAMTAHIVIDDIDPDTPITLSKVGIDFLRDQIGFDGLLMTDDLDMKALSGSLKTKTAKALQAGCDMALHCSGDFRAMVEVAQGARFLSGDAALRAGIADLCAGDPKPFDYDAAMAEYQTLVNQESLAA